MTQMSDQPPMKKYEPHFWKLLILLLVLVQGIIGFLAKDIYSKVNNGVFVHKPQFRDTVEEMHRDDEVLRREICERLKRLEHNQDLILQRLR